MEEATWILLDNVMSLIDTKVVQGLYCYHNFSIESMRSAHQLELNQEVQKMKTNHKLQEQQWTNKEYDKKRIQQLETKVRTLVNEFC